MKKISISTLIFAIFVPLVVGGVSALISSKAMEAYGTMKKPPLSPPAWAFSVAWTLLYIMMGLASYFIFVAKADNKEKTVAIIIYAFQLAMNFFWSFIFFNLGMYLFACIWLLGMWCLVIVCTYKFYNISRIAAFPMVPYILWLTFAAYLNFGAFILKIS